VFTWPWFVSTIIGLIALFLSILAYRRRYSEDVRVNVRPSSRPYPIAWTCTSTDDPSQTLYLVTEWECALINVGDRHVNITQWGVLDPHKRVIPMPQAYKIKDPLNGPVALINTKKHIHRDVYELAPDEEIPFPMDIAAGTSKTFKVRMGLPIERSCQELVQEELNSERMGDNTQEIVAFLRKKDLTIYGPGVVDKFLPLYFQSASGKRFIEITALYLHKVE